MRSLRRAISAAIACATFFALLPLVMASDVAPADASQVACGYWLNGVDVSNYQPSINWSQVSHSVAAAYIEEGDGSWSSPTFAGQKAGAAAAGLPWGAYFFAEPSANVTTATNDAFVFVSHGGASGVLPPVLDTETSNGLSAAQVAAWDAGWIAEVQSLSHRPVMIYTGAYPWAYSSLNSFPLWIAAYPAGYNPVQSACGLPLPSTFGWSSWEGWQFTSSATIPGISGNVDKSVFEPSFFETFVGATVTPGGVVYGPGSIGPAVTVIQKMLSTAGVYHGPIDGNYSNDLYVSVQTWQTKLGEVPDGFWGPATAAATSALLNSLAAIVPLPKPTISAGQRGTPVWNLQHALNVARAGSAKKLWPVAPTHGYYLASTVKVVKAFDNVCPGVHGWPGLHWLPRDSNCLKFILALEHKTGVVAP